MSETENNLTKTVIDEINTLILEISVLVKKYQPDLLLKNAFDRFAATCFDEKASIDKSVSMWVLEYIQSLIAALNPDPQYSNDLEHTETLFEKVEKMFFLLNMSYPAIIEEYNNKKDEKIDFEMQRVQLQIGSLWMNVRGKRYHFHEKIALLDILEPHSDIITELFGISAQSLVEGLNAILLKLTSGYDDAAKKIKISFDDFTASNIDAVEDYFKAKGVSDETHTAFTDVFWIGLLDVERNSKLPMKLLEMLSWRPGEEKNFFEPGQFCGWPIKIWPTMKRPFINFDGKIICTNIFLFDNIYRTLQKIILTLKPSYKQTWNIKQKEISELLPFKYFEILLPGSIAYKSVYYQHKASGNEMKWCETDGLLIYDNHLLIIEVKGGAFTYTDPITDFQAHVNSLQSLVKSPASQGERFIDYLKASEEVSIFDSKEADRKDIARLRYTNFNSITVCAITIDSFTEHAARAQHFSCVGIELGSIPVWALSIDDLRVYADLFKNPLIFLHFIKQRMSAAKNKKIELLDEKHHINMYLICNNYVQFVEERAKLKREKTVVNSDCEIINNYYAEIFFGNQAILPKQNMPARFAEIIDFLGKSSKPNRSQLANYLLDYGGDCRDIIAKAIDEQLLKQSRYHHSQAVSVANNPFTLWVYSALSERNKITALEHAQSLALIYGYKKYILVELEYSEDSLLADVHWEYVYIQNIPKAETSRLYQEGLTWRRKHALNFCGRAKIKGSTLCPCNSGLKHKNCCRKFLKNKI